MVGAGHSHYQKRRNKLSDKGNVDIVLSGFNALFHQTVCKQLPNGYGINKRRSWSVGMFMNHIIYMLRGILLHGIGALFAWCVILKVQRDLLTNNTFFSC